LGFANNEDAPQTGTPGRWVLRGVCEATSR
jgi:hypothetical protein